LTAVIEGTYTDRVYVKLWFVVIKTRSVMRPFRWTVPLMGGTSYDAGSFGKVTVEVEPDGYAVLVLRTIVGDIPLVRVRMIKSHSTDFKTKLFGNPISGSVRIE